MRVSIAVQSDVGLVREVNEDHCLALNLDDIDQSWLVGVADGMGGHQAGEVASSLALGMLASSLGDGPGDGWLGALQQGVTRANLSIFEAASARDDRAGMGTTVTAAVLSREKMFLVHVGDSRAYLFRDGRMEILTRDDSLVGELLRKGDLTPDEARGHPQKHVLTRAVGTQPDVAMQLLERSILPGDRLLICSDGLHNLVADEDLGGMLVDSDLDRAVLNMVRTANQRGGFDNITVVAVEVESL